MSRHTNERGHGMDVMGRRIRSVLTVSAVVIGMLVPALGAEAASPGTPYAWGANPWGQLGDGTTTAHLMPHAVTGLTDAIDIDGGRDHAIALRANGSVLTWGHNNFGQIGDGSTGNRLVPTTVPGLSNVIDVEAGHDHSLALLADGTVRAWGYNALGQLGDGTTTNRRSPVTVAGLTNVVSIAGGRDMSFAVRSDGTLWGWGANDVGQLGDGTSTNRTTPVRVGTLSGVVSAAGGRDHGLALLSNGTVWGWGDNTYGQVGDGTLTTRRSPVQVTGLSNVVSVTAGATHSLALLANGTVRSWGRNQLGQLGDGSTTTRRTSVAVSGLSNVVAIGTGRDHGLAALADGTVRAWGQNDFGQLGDGTTTNRTLPIVVNGLSGVVDVQGGRDYSLALIPQGPQDTVAPTTPGKPSGQSLSSSSIDIAWAAATDDVSLSLTYRVFRDGSLAGTFASSSTTTVGFTDTGLPPASTHTYTVTAADAAGNVSPSSEASDAIVVQSGQDTVAPTTPGKPSGQSLSSSSIDIAWAAATDDVSLSLTYRVFRDGSLAGTFASSSTTTVGFTDTGLPPASTHTYTVTAADAAGNVSPSSEASDAILVQSGPAVIFSDDFSTGTFAKWTAVTRLTIDGSLGGASPPSVRGSVANQTATAATNLSGTFSNVCVSFRVNVSARTGAMVLTRLRTATDGPVVRIFLNASGVLSLRSDVSGTTRSATAAFGTGWHVVELCGQVGTAGTWDLYRDGVKVISAWPANTGTVPIGRLEIGNATAGTWTANFDDVVVDQTPG